MTARTLQLGLCALLTVAAPACAQEATPEIGPSPSAGLGEPCSSEVACTGALLCVDGLCADRGELPDPVPGAPELWTAPDATNSPEDAQSEVTPPGDALADVDSSVDALVSDTSLSDAAPPDVLTDVGLDALQVDAEDTGAGALDAAEDTSDVQEEEDVETETVLILLKDDSMEAGAGDTYFLLGEGEAWVADLSTPVDGDLKYAEIFLADVSAPASCGRFRLAVWAPDENGVLPDNPTHEEAQPHLLAGGGEGQTLSLNVPVALKAGDFRIGVIHDGPCTDDDFSPALMSDDSGVVGGTWLWIPVDGTPPWVPASVFGVDGRWGIRAILEGEKVLEP